MKSYFNFVLILEAFSTKYSNQKGCPVYENSNILKKDIY